MFDLVAILNSLSKNRPVFHSEADLQHALAWAIHKAVPDADIRLEVPYARRPSSEYLDLRVNTKTHSYAIELKYKTRALSVEVKGEGFGLKSHGAQDLGRYDFFRDLQRVESLCSSYASWLGWVIFLTNDSSYWKKPTRSVAYEAFRMEEGRTVSGTLQWGNSAGEGTIKNREDPIFLSGAYEMNWQDYSLLGVASYSRFRYLSIPVYGDRQV